MRWTHRARIPNMASRNEVIMELYFAPLAASVATRIALYEVGVPATFVQVDRRTKLTERGYGKDLLIVRRPSDQQFEKRITIACGSRGRVPLGFE